LTRDYQTFRVKLQTKPVWTVDFSLPELAHKRGILLAFILTQLGELIYQAFVFP